MEEEIQKKILELDQPPLNENSKELWFIHEMTCSLHQKLKLAYMLGKKERNNAQ